MDILNGVSVIIINIIIIDFEQSLLSTVDVEHNWFQEKNTNTYKNRFCRFNSENKFK